MTHQDNPKPIEGLVFTPRTAPRVIQESVRVEPLVSARKEKVVNTLLTTKGGAKLIQPDQDAVSAAVASAEKLRYFGVANTEAFKGSLHERMTDYEFALLVFEPLLQQVRQDHPDKQRLTFRGGMASINGTQTYDYGHSSTIPDVTEIVKNGGDREGVFNAATSSMEIPVTDICMNLHRVNQYAGSTGFRRYEIGGDAPEVAETLFPVVSVYDSSLLRSAGGNVWAVEPKDGNTASDALLATYVLDCPTAR